MAVNTQLQVRRGTASQWTSTNPTLAAGEFGSTAWISLSYASLTTSDIPELSQDAIDQALVAGTGITKSYNDGANTLTLAVDTTAIQARVSGVSDTEIGYLDGVTSAIQTQIDSKAPIASPTFTGTVSGITKSMVGLGNVDNTSDESKPVSTATQTALDAKAPIASPTFTGTVTLPNNTVTNAMLAGSIANNKLANSSVTINGSVVSLGGSTTIQAGPDEIAVIMGALI
jgi:hypothetical protein